MRGESISELVNKMIRERQFQFIIVYICVRLYLLLFATTTTTRTTKIMKFIDLIKRENDEFIVTLLKSKLEIDTKDTNLTESNFQYTQHIYIQSLFSIFDLYLIEVYVI